MPLCILYHKGHCSTAHSYVQMPFVPKLRKAYSIILDANSTLEGPSCPAWCAQRLDGYTLCTSGIKEGKNSNRIALVLSLAA